MGRLIERFSAWIQDTFGLNRLGDNFKKFSIMHFAFSIFTSSYSVFISTLFLRVTGDSNVVMYYNMILYLCVGYIMALAVLYTRRHNMLWSTRIGIFCYIGMYLVLFLVMDRIDQFMPVLAVLNALSSGFYWLTYSALLSHYTSDENRDVALSVLGLLTGFVSLCIPAVAGAVIEAFGGFTGYYIMFGFSFAVAILTVFLSFRLPAHRQTEKKTYYKEVLKNVFTNRCWRSGMLTETFKGIREGAFGFFLNILLYELVQSEAIIGVNTLLLGIASMVSFWAAGKIIRPHNRIKCMLVATTVLVLACLIFAISFNPVTIIVLGILSNLFGTFIVNPASSSFFLLVQKMPGGMRAREEYFGIREIFLNAGRVIGVIILLVFPTEDWRYTVAALIVLTLTQYITALLCKRAVKAVNSYSEEHEQITT